MAKLASRVQVMTDSTIDENAGDALEVGPSVEELFGPLEESREESRDGAIDPHLHHPNTELSTIESRVDEIADRTADEVFKQFEQFRSEVDGECDVDGVLADESPEEIIASADEDEDDTGVLGDEDDLEDLLLTGRQAGSEFLWVDTDDEDASSPEPPVSEEAASNSTEGPTAEESAVAVSEECESTDSAPTQAEPPESASGETGDTAVDDEMTTEAEELDDHEEETETTEADEDRPSGFFGWLRAKLGL